MHAVQIVMADPGRAREISRYLSAKTNLRVRRSPTPSPRSQQVLLVDEGAFRAALRRILHPERIVLLAPRPGEVWEEAMRAGVVSIVSEQDSLETVMMAVLCADLRLTRHSGCRSLCANIPRSLCPLCAATHEGDWNRINQTAETSFSQWPQTCKWKM